MSKITDFGFDFGSMKVTRTCSDKFASVMSIETPKAKFSVRATKTGNIRFYSESGNECELVAKDYIQQLEADQVKYK